MRYTGKSKWTQQDHTKISRDIALANGSTLDTFFPRAVSVSLPAAPMTYKFLTAQKTKATALTMFQHHTA